MKLDDRIQWTQWLPTDERPVSGRLRELLQQVIDHQPKRLLPPLSVLNDILQRKQVGGGMGGGLSWQSDIALSEPEYTEFRTGLPAPRRGIECDATTVEEWTARVYEQFHGVDYGEHLAQLSLLAVEEAKTRDPGDWELLQARQRYMDYIMAALTRARG